MSDSERGRVAGRLGNPDLEPYLSDNIDLGFEYYTGEEGYFGVAAFRKGIEGLHAAADRNITFGDLAAVRHHAGLARASSSVTSVNARGGNSRHRAR